MDKFGKLGDTYVMRFRFLVFLLCAGLAACSHKTPPKPLPPVPSIQKSGELVVITRDSSTTYYEDAEGKLAGLEHDLVELFAKQLGVKARFVIANHVGQILPLLEKHQAHLAAASLNITPDRQKQFKFGTPYQTIRIQVVYNASGNRPNGIKDLVGKRIEVVAGSSYAELLKEARKQYPNLTWVENATQDSEELLDKLARGSLDAVVTDSNTASLSHILNPDLEVAFTLSEKQKLAWVFPGDVDADLLAKAGDFFAKIEKDGTLRRLLDRYYGHVNRLERADVESFLLAENTILPKLRRHFQHGQELTGLDWRLIAAVGYQESHWNPLATSPTGVRGLMMLTSDTADQMGVSNRLDARQNILAGARYIQYMKDTIPERIPEPDRTWMALAAYNVGYGHLEDARVLAKKLTLNPDSWTDLKSTLPLLAWSEYHPMIKHGYARGGESVIFTETVRTYYDILVRLENPYETVFPAQVSKSDEPPPPPNKYSLVKAGSARTSQPGLKLPAYARRPDTAEEQLVP